MGAMASIFPDPNNNDQVYFMGTNMISPFGILNSFRDSSVYLPYFSNEL